MSHLSGQYMGLANIRLSAAAAADSSDAAELIRHAAVSGPSACMFMHRSHTGAAREGDPAVRSL